MAIKDRLVRLEGGRGDGRCACGVFAVIVNGEFVRASQHDRPISEEEWRVYDDAKTDGTCGLCGGELPPKIVIGGPKHGAQARGKGRPR
jgi:hypothetical protein